MSSDVVLSLVSLLSTPRSPLPISETGWIALFDEASRHGILAPIMQELDRRGLAVPAPVRQEVQRRHVFERIAQARQHDALNEALTALNGAGVTTVALKGPTLAERLYEDPLQRRSTDLDLMVATRDIGRARAALESTGYRMEEGPSLRYYLRHHHHVVFERTGSPPIELHFRLFTGFGSVVPSEGFIERSRLHERGPRPRARVLMPEDELFYLAVHASSHGLGRLAWLQDLKLLLERFPEIDGRRARELARAHRLENAFLFCCEGLLRLLGVRARGVWDGGRTRAIRRSRFSLASRLASVGERRATKDPVRRIAELTYEAVLSDRAATGAHRLAHHVWRVSRRRAASSFPRLLPREWSA